MSNFCYRCGRPIEFIRGVVNRFGKLIPLDPDGSIHKHIFLFSAEGPT